MADDVRAMLKAAHSLDGGKDANNELYRRWATTYDDHLLSDGYVGHHMCALMVQQIAQTASPNVLDAGCGTGLVGRELAALMPQARVTGADLSPDMAESAEATGTYVRAVADIDLNQPLPESLSDTFEIIVCCGTFSLGHVGTDGLEHIVRAAPRGGHIIFSVRREHSLEHRFVAAVQALIDSGLAETVSELYNAPYIANGGADYWTLRRL